MASQRQDEEDIISKSNERLSLEAAQEHITKASQFSLEGDLEAASEEFNKALEIQIELLDELDPAIGKTYMELGMLSQAGKKDTEAIEYYDKSLKILENQAEGAYSEDVATIYEFIGDIYDEEGNLEEAVGFYQEALELRKEQQEVSKSSDEEKKDLGGLYEKIGDSFVGLKQFTLAKEAYLEALEIFNKKNENSKVLDITPLVGYCMYQEGELDDALKYYQEAIKMYEKENGGEAGFDIVEIWEHIANIMLKKMDFNESISYNQKALDFYLKQRLVGRTKDIYENLGKAYESEGLEEKALELYKSGINAFIDYYRTDHPAIDQLYEALTELAEKIGKVDEISDIETRIKEVKEIKEFKTDFLG